MLRKLVAGLALVAIPAGVAVSGPVDVANDVRSAGCGALSVADRPLRSQARLDDAARLVARGDALEKAIAETGYRARQSAFVHVYTATGDQGVAQTLTQRFCDFVADSNFRDIGIHQRGEHVWMVLAAPFSPPVTDDAAVNRRVLELINEARSKTRRCGRRKFHATGQLTRIDVLDRAAYVHAKDMAAHSTQGHRGSDGSMPDGRVTSVGYAWSAVAENFAAGQTTAQEVINTWLASPGHCANLMNPVYTHTGVAYAVDPASDKGIYWVQVFAAPQ